MSLRTMTSREILFKILIPVFCVFAVAGAVLGALFGTGVIGGNEEEIVILRPPKEEVLPIEDEDTRLAKLYEFTRMDSLGGYQITRAKTRLDANLVLPSTYRGEPVVSIGSNCFVNHTEILSVQLPDCLKEILTGAFHNCSIAMLEIPNSVTTVGDNAFDACAQLQNVKLGQGIETISATAFSNCSQMREVFIDYAVIGVEFQRNASIESVVLGDNVTTIESGAFAYCENLSSFSMSDSVVDMQSFAFYQCVSLTSFVVGNGVPAIHNDTFDGCKSLRTFTIGSSVTEIVGGAFRSSHTKLTEVYNLSQLDIQPGSSEHSGVAYYAAAVYTDVNIESKVKKSSENDDFLVYSDPDKDIYVLVGYEGDGTNVQLPSYVDGQKYSIGNGLFIGGQFSSIVIPETVVGIGGKAFYHCKNLVEVEIPNSVTKIGDSAFAGCINVESISIGSGLKTIDDYVFQSCEKLTSIVIPDNVESIGIWAFSSCYALETVAMGNGLKTIGHGAFQHCKKLSSIDIPKSVTQIGHYVFLNTGLTKVVIGSGVENIGEGVFSGCTYLEEIVFDDGINWANLALNSYSMPSQPVTLVVAGTDQTTIETALTKLATFSISRKSQYTIQIDASLVGVISNTYGFAAIEAI